MRMIAVDLDGTLLNSESKVAKDSIDAIKKARDNGIEVVIATGRASFDVQAIFQSTGIKTWIISANGAVIHDPEGRLYHAVPIDPKKAEGILEWLEEKNYYYEVFSDDAIFTPQNGKELLEIELDRLKSANPGADFSRLEQAAEQQISQHGYAYIRSYRELYQPDRSVNVYNILGFSFDQEKLEEGWQRFKDAKDITLVTSAEHNFEIEHLQASKGLALEKLSQKLGIPLHETAAVGDSLNDCSMLKIAGKSFAMGNAREDIKELADEVAPTNDENGVAHILHKLIEQNVKSV
ncbi:Cof-type HAD-IIB family hydrolase [Bacillus swezeyi]|uniref:Phosphatase n=1 Tax=Bacillus swezeyi TaxID=1925020 RepID=A0A1R1QWF6_9BACI|nr:Cof-type HAD-IIB family hydrolase [Bacillus swezeyi]MEC1259339.1 Cof-type HAD-IIB family hydrolase [Bacillus swezeyi]MED2927699.1 Cof-type HAD-IIB family hydrolase [Bacillus swezeyi]MED2965388.1 Cof-type HAD-IIB family hydrolase [Bacillus swezeyi]MED2977506.1 Cof-type HAD-IIB family hydrolase [Bacillus swezeyi]MED3071649.1 Cof-type HAD-IIB family hydrolase [Bacillus swezeyi]